jgi:protein SCO1/2
MNGKTLILGLAMIVALSELAQAHSMSGPAASSVTITRSHHSNFGGSFSLIDQDGRAVSSVDFRGTPMLIYFGYTNCTDACPLDTQAMSLAVDALDRRGISVVPLFITVDPERDSPARLKEFLEPFHSRIVGLTGPVDTVMKVTTAYGASGEGDKGSPKVDGGYEVSHAAIAYLMGRNGEFLDVVSLRDQSETVAEHIAKFIADADHHR